MQLVPQEQLELKELHKEETDMAHHHTHHQHLEEEPEQEEQEENEIKCLNEIYFSIFKLIHH